MGFGSLFHTTNKGILPMTELKQTASLSKTFFGFSLGVEILFMLVFIAIFLSAIFRSVKKIKNPKFKVEKEEDQSEGEEN